MNDNKKDSKNTEKNTEIKEFGHDVLNSLTRIIGHLEVSLKTDDIEQIKKKIATTLQTAHECADFCKENMQGNENEKASFLLTSFFKDLQESYKKTFPDFQIQVQSLNAASVEVESNRAMLRNAIQNLTKNSMEAGAKKMVILLELHRISFIDNGPGISKEKATTIKEKGTTKTDAKGHGLGLLSLSRFCGTNAWKLHFHNNANQEYFPTGFTVEFIFKG
jgi:signal transduction histidine kinase